MPTCPPPSMLPKKCSPPYGVKQPENTGLFEGNVPENAIRWNKTVCPPCKGVYTWVSSPKAMLHNRKMTKATPQ